MHKLCRVWSNLNHLFDWQRVIVLFFVCTRCSCSDQVFALSLQLCAAVIELNARSIGRSCPVWISAFMTIRFTWGIRRMLYSELCILAIRTFSSCKLGMFSCVRVHEEQWRNECANAFVTCAGDLYTRVTVCAVNRWEWVYVHCSWASHLISMHHDLVLGINLHTKVARWSRQDCGRNRCNRYTWGLLWVLAGVVPANKILYAYAYCI